MLCSRAGHGHGATGFCVEPQTDPRLENHCALRGHGRGTAGAPEHLLGQACLWMLRGDISAPRSPEAAWDLLRIQSSQAQPRHEPGTPGGGGHSSHGDLPPTGIPVPSIPGMWGSGGKGSSPSL